MRECRICHTFVRVTALVSPMPPKKDQLSPVDLRQKAHDHGIRFHGPVPPSAWPDEYRHNFEVIRALQFLRYEEYTHIERIPTRRKADYQKRVKDLRMKVRYLLEDVDPNESSWRELERPIFDRFDGSVIWYVTVQPYTRTADLTRTSEKCNNELSKSDFEAIPFNKERQSKLDAKRNMRKYCACNSKRSQKQIEDQ
jgi:hypothetical protein